MANGKGIAYQALRPLEGDIASDILNNEDQEYRRRQERRIDEDRRTRALAAKEAARQKALGRVKNIQADDTKSDTLNATLADAIMLAQTKGYPEIFKVLDNPQKYSAQDQIQAQLKLDYLNGGGLVADLKKMTNGVATEYSDYIKNRDAGKILPNKAYEKRFENGFKGITISLDDNLRPVTLFRNTGFDADGDGIIDVETLESLDDTYARPKFYNNYDFESALNEHAEKLVSAVNTDATGFSTTKTTGIEPEQLENEARRYLFNPNGTPKDTMEVFLFKRGLENTPENQQLILQDYKNGLEVRSKRGVEEDFNASAYVSSLKEERLSQENKAQLGEVVDPTQRTYSIYYGNIDTSKVNNVPVQGGAKIPAIKTEKGEFVSNLQPHNITRDKFGRMVIEGSYQETKTETMTKSKYDEEIKEALKDNSKEGRERLYNLQQAVQNEKGMRITIASKNKRKDITVSKEDEVQIANSLGVSVKDLDARIYKPQTKVELPNLDGLPDLDE